MEYNVGDRVRVISKDEFFSDYYMYDYIIEAFKYGGILLDLDGSGFCCLEVYPEDIELVNRKEDENDNQT